MSQTSARSVATAAEAELVEALLERIAELGRTGKAKEPVL